MSKARALLSWSSGKDSAWTLYKLKQDPSIEVAGLLTSFNEAADRVSMHAVRRELVQAQAAAAGLLLFPVQLPWPCTNADYEKRMGDAMASAKSAGITHVAFGDLFLEDIRNYRISKLSDTGITPLFPIWTSASATPALARKMIAAGLQATLTCVDPKQLDPRFVGREFEQRLLDDLPPSVDPCGERGEFHTFCHTGPMFAHPIPIERGETVERDGFWFADLRLASGDLGAPATDSRSRS
jgi:uncharacterized protein (TIGR00290 family)